jgi:hypothetical protein
MIETPLFCGECGEPREVDDLFPSHDDRGFICKECYERREVKRIVREAFSDPDVIREAAEKGAEDQKKLLNKMKSGTKENTKKTG